MLKMYFENMNESPLTLSVPAWQTEFLDRIGNDESIIAQVKAANKEFVEMMKDNLSRAAEGYEGTAVRGAMRKTHRNITMRVNANYTADIDLLMRTVAFEEG